MRVAAALATPERCLLTTSVTATTLPAALCELREAAQSGADLVELRLDCISSFVSARDLPVLLEGSPLPVIVTCRASWEGGRPFSGTEEERLSTLWEAVALDVAYVDVELKAAAQFFALAPHWWARETSRTRFILSSHNYEHTPSEGELEFLHSAAVAAGADIVKIATTCHRITDVERLEAFLATCGQRKLTIALGMGEYGLVRKALLSTTLSHLSRPLFLQISRLLAPKFGSYLTFGALSPGRESAPGQPVLQDMVNLYHMTSQACPTPIFYMSPPHFVKSAPKHARAWRRRQPCKSQPQSLDSQCCVGFCAS